MKSGLISKGNADGLDSALKKEDNNKISSILKTWFEDAQTKNCKAVLISAEALVHQLAIQNRLDLLSKSANNIGFKNIEAMGFFRDLADHALSTYKHRAKSGNIPNYKHWISNIYETPKLFEKLTKVIHENQHIKWTLRKFQKDSNFLKQAFFKDWLAIEIPVFKEQPTVNESVTLSEVQVMNHFKKAYPLVLDFFVEDFKALPKSKKAKDKELDNYILQVFTKALNLYQGAIDQINVFFSKEEKLIIGSFNKILNDEPNIQLSENQLEILTKRMIFFNSWEGKRVFLRRNLVKIVRKISSDTKLICF
jgi:hypothetical protein